MVDILDEEKPIIYSMVIQKTRVFYQLMIDLLYIGVILLGLVLWHINR